MRLTRTVPMALLCSIILGCSGGMNTTMTQNPVLMTGTFGATAHSQTTTTNYQIGGIFATDSSGHVIGHTHVDGSACFDFLLTIDFTGSINAQGQFTLTSSAFNGQTITITGTLSTDGQTITGGSFTISGGCANGDHGTLSGFALQGVFGAYQSNFTVNGNNIAVAVSLSANTSAPSGLFPVSGTVTISNSGSCSLPSSGTLTGESGANAGADLHATFLNGQNTLVSFQGVATDSTAKIVQGTWTINSGPCSGMTASGALLRP